MRVTTMRVRPARAAVVREEHALEVTRDQVEVTIFGQTVAIAKVTDTELVIQWAREDISETQLHELLTVYCDLIEQAERAGVMS